MVNCRVSRDLKERAVAPSAIGYDAPTAADILGDPGGSVKGWILRTRIIEEIHGLLHSSPALYPDEIASWIAISYGQPVSISTLQHSLKTLGYCVKKLRKAAAQHDELTREQQKAEILSHFTADQLVFADESSKVDRTSERRYGRAVAAKDAVKLGTLLQDALALNILNA
ncbi:hypothetical protein ONZ51_g28 [Trametes cubensis]|uniref:Winged helix-turn helix domain-containing protein n=1 Tax=Trametes cubensis TaxID=1111947 RepID=A0AAD7U408_9APHY|nr:hypothetical protein ONZ51_g28 [Trametes cubensis]